MGTEAEQKSADACAKRRALRLRIMAIGLAFVGLLIYEEWDSSDDHAMLPDASEAEVHGAAGLAGGGGADELVPVDPLAPLVHLENCTVSFQPQPAKKNGEWSTKPLWFPSHPGTIEESLHKRLIHAMTGLNAGGKSLYASSKQSKLRQCFGQTETATCSNVHPVVDMGSKHPDTRATKFCERYIMGLRNPMTNLPAFYNGKAIKYHGLCEGCQVPEDEWRKHRDEWLRGMMEGWTNLISTWKKMKKYNVGLYVVYEHMFDPVRGPETLKRLASLLKEAGFDTAPEEDLPCIWYKTMGKDTLEAYYERPYEYKDYIPGYTVVQREDLFGQLNTLAGEQSNDTELVGILREYQQDIRARARIDREWKKNETDAKKAE